MTSTSSTGYTVQELSIFRTELDGLYESARSHGTSCLDCYDYGQCEFAEYIQRLIEEVQDSLGYTSPEDSNASLIRDADYRDLVADYIQVSSEVVHDRWDELSPERNLSDAVDGWWASPSARAAIEDVSEPHTAAEGDASQVWLEDALWGTMVLWDEEATQANLQAAARIWRTRRGELGIYKTFIRNFRSTQTDFSFHAYCSVCRSGFNFSGSLNELRAHMLRVVRHAHTHVPGTSLEFFDAADGENTVTFAGSDSIPEPLANAHADVAFVKRGGTEFLDSLRRKHSGGTPLSAHECELARAWEGWLAQL